jgi:hypothetical protein
MPTKARDDVGDAHEATLRPELEEQIEVEGKLETLIEATNRPPS